MNQGQVQVTVQEIRNEQVLASIIAQRDAMLLASNEQLGQAMEQVKQLKAKLEESGEELKEIRTKLQTLEKMFEEKVPK